MNPRAILQNMSRDNFRRLFVSLMTRTTFSKVEERLADHVLIESGIPIK